MRRGGAVCMCRRAVGECKREIVEAFDLGLVMVRLGGNFP